MRSGVAALATIFFTGALAGLGLASAVFDVQPLRQPGFTLQSVPLAQGMRWITAWPS
jgi:hypothetical protein